MMHKAWRSIEEVRYCFSRSSIKFHGHTGGKIDDLNPIWDYLAGRSYQIPQICLVELCQVALRGDFYLLDRDFYHLGQNSRIPHLCCLRNGEPVQETYLPDWTPVL